MIRLFCASLLFAASTVAVPDPSVLEQFEARYLVKSSGATVGTVEWTLTAGEDGGYVYQSVTEPAGLLSLLRNEVILERSEGRYVDSRPRPLEYRYQRRGGKRDKTVSVRFDWERGLAFNTAKGETWRMPVPDSTLDKLNYLLVMMQDLSRGERNVDYQVADGGKLKPYVLRGAGSETIDTAIGSLRAIKVRRIRNNSKRETMFWCAEALRYLPVKIEHRESDGSVLIVTLESVSGLALEAGNRGGS